MTQTVTKRQLQMLIFAWKVGDIKIPTKGKDTVVEFPRTDQYSFQKLIIRKTDGKSGDGRILYSLEFQEPII